MDRCLFLHVISCGIILSSIVPAFAEEPKSGALMQTLPVDGAWVTYNVNVKVNEQEFLMTGTARSVGQAVHGGKQSRFIEYEQTVGSAPSINVPQLGNLTWRLLVPEEEFGEGKDPLSKASHKWVKYDTIEPDEVESIERKDPIFAILFQGPKRNLKFEDAKEKIKWQQGELQCPVISGQNQSGLGLMKLDMTHRVFLDRDVPFGIAGLHEDLKIAFGGQSEKVVIRATLRDHGKDAKAKLPNLVP